MAKTRPKRSEGYDFEALTADEFESLCHQLILIENPTAVKLRPSDLGADSLLPSVVKLHGYDHAWQAKRHTSGIKWADCEKSLDDVVKNYQVPHVTFCFPFDLTGPQELIFRDRLRSRHASNGVKVDYIGRAALEALMADSGRGKRVAERFFSNQDPNELVSRALRAGGPLDSIDAAAARAFALGEFTSGNDGLFEYPLEVSEIGSTAQGSQRRPDAAMSLSIEEEELRFTAHAVPRKGVRMEPPTGTIKLPDAESVEKLRRLQSGGKATFENATLTLENLPPMFERFIQPTSEGRIELHVQREPAPYAARIVVRSTRGIAKFDVDLNPGDPSNEWDAVLTGISGNVSISIKLRWNHDTKRGEFSIEWSYSHRRQPCSVLKKNLEFFKAMHGDGEFEITDRFGDRPPLTQAVPATEIPEQISALLLLAERVEKIGDYVGADLFIPQEIEEDAAKAVFFVAHSIENGGYSARFASATIDYDAKKIDALLDGPLVGMKVDQPVQAEVFGEVVELGIAKMNLPPMTGRLLEGPKNGEPSVPVRIQPASADDSTIWVALPPKSK